MRFAARIGEKPDISKLVHTWLLADGGSQTLAEPRGGEVAASIRLA
jgi:hypothetical protein